MLVSWNWLKDYVALDMEPAELEQRLAMSGLNHESTKRVAGDLAIDLEVTSNRPDCLGHIGVAREIAVLWQRELKTPAAEVKESATPVTDLTKVSLQCPELCYRYTARVIRGAKVGPSPDWLADRLEAIGIALVNNIVDISNYVLMECGQPLHTFDFAKLGGREIVVRQARQGEEFEAIDHKTYKLDAEMCVIADANVPVAIGGVMGGAETEISTATTELLIEAAVFAPMSIRSTARKLNLHSDSSYRFERGIDPRGVDWASRRCCELILDIAGGELASGVIDVGRDSAARQPVVLRLLQLQRVLGITIQPDEVRRILTALGCEEQKTDESSIEIRPPSWRRDLTREIDLVEEVARIHGYDKIPEDVAVPMASSHRSDEDRVLAKVRGVLTSAGFDEAMTCSIVPSQWSDAFSPWTDAEPIVSGTPMKGVLGEASKNVSQADTLRRSLIPSLLESRRINESLSNPTIELFETAHAYLPTGDGLPNEPHLIGITSGGDFYYLKGVVEGMLTALNPSAQIETTKTNQPLLDTVKSCELRLNGKCLGFLGEIVECGLDKLNLRGRTTVAELDLSVLGSAANLIPQFAKLSPYPSIARDFNFIVDETLNWSDLAATVTSASGDVLEKIEFGEIFRDVKRDGPGKKRMLLTVTLRAADRTLTGEEADAVSSRIINACGEGHGAKLLG